MRPMLGTAIETRIRELALSFPATYEDHPWGDFPVFKAGQVARGRLGLVSSRVVVGVAVRRLGVWNRRLF
jgi:hypothetical protein